MTEKITINAPMPGVFYRRPDPEEPLFVEEGDRVEAGDVVCMVGVMKNFHEVTTDTAGTVSAVLVENEEPIDAGQPLVEITPE